MDAKIIILSENARDYSKLEVLKNIVKQSMDDPYYDHIAMVWANFVGDTNTMRKEIKELR